METVIRLKHNQKLKRLALAIIKQKGSNLVSTALLAVTALLGLPVSVPLVVFLGGDPVDVGAALSYVVSARGGIFLGRIKLRVGSLTSRSSTSTKSQKSQI